MNLIDMIEGFQKMNMKKKSEYIIKIARNNKEIISKDIDESETLKGISLLSIYLKKYNEKYKNVIKELIKYNVNFNGKDMNGTKIINILLRRGIRDEIYDIYYKNEYSIILEQENDKYKNNIFAELCKYCNNRKIYLVLKDMIKKKRGSLHSQTYMREQIKKIIKEQEERIPIIIMLARTGKENSKYTIDIIDEILRIDIKQIDMKRLRHKNISMNILGNILESDNQDIIYHLVRKYRYDIIEDASIFNKKKTSEKTVNSENDKKYNDIIYTYYISNLTLKNNECHRRMKKIYDIKGEDKGMINSIYRDVMRMKLKKKNIQKDIIMKRNEKYFNPENIQCKIIFEYYNINNNIFIKEEISKKTRNRIKFLLDIKSTCNNGNTERNNEEYKNKINKYYEYIIAN